MKIVHLVWALQNGGIETMLVNVANEQVRNGDKVFILIINDSVDENLIKTLNKDIKVYKKERKIGSRNLFPIVWANFLILFIYPKIMHFHFLNIAKLFIKFRKIKFISTVHETNFPDRYFKKYDRIIAISKAVKESLFKIKPEIETIVCYNGINFNRVVKKQNYYNFKNIICVGRLVDDKNQALIIRALHVLKLRKNINLTVSFVGDGPNKLKLQQLTKKLKLENNIKFLGNMSNEWVLNYLRKYDLFIQASTFEGFGLTALEAVAARLPTILSDVDGHLEISDNGKYATLFKSGDPKDLANKIIKLSNEFKLIENKCLDANNYALNFFSIKHQVKRLDEIYNL